MPDRGEPGFIYGNDGDGFFNLWVMEYVRQSVRRGNLNLGDGRIYWPHNENTYFWSDRLLIPTLVYSFCRASAKNIFTAYRWTAVLLAGAGFLAFVWLFRLLFLLAGQNRGNLPGPAIIMIVPIAYLAFFSSGRLMYFVHFQNPSSFWLTTLAAGLIVTSA